MKAKHLVVAKEVIVGERMFHYIAIPVGMVEKVVLLRPRDLDPELLREISTRVEKML